MSKRPREDSFLLLHFIRGRVVVEKTGDKIELAGEDCASGRKEQKERAFRASLEVLFLAGEG